MMGRPRDGAVSRDVIHAPSRAVRACVLPSFHAAHAAYEILSSRTCNMDKRDADGARRRGETVLTPLVGSTVFFRLRLSGTRDARTEDYSVFSLDVAWDARVSGRLVSYRKGDCHVVCAFAWVKRSSYCGRCCGGSVSMHALQIWG